MKKILLSLVFASIAAAQYKPVLNPFTGRFDLVNAVSGSASNGIIFWNGSGLSSTGTGGAGTLCLVSTDGGAPVLSACSGSAATAWSSLTAPSGNLSVAMAARATTFTYNATTGAINGFKLTDTVNNTGTGILHYVTTASGSAMTPAQFDANGVGFQFDKLGVFRSVGGTNSQGSLTAGPKVYLGPAIGGFNSFDQATVQGLSIFSQLNHATSWAPIIGLNETNDTSIGFNVGGYFQASATNASGAVQNNIGLFGEGDGFPTSTGTVAALGGVEGLTELHSGTATIQAPFITYAKVDAATTATNLVDFYTQGHIINGTVVNNYGIFLADITGGTTINQAIHTGAGWNFFGDRVTIGNTAVSPNNLLTVKGTSTGLVSLGYISDATTFGCITYTNTLCSTSNYFFGGNGTDNLINSPSGNIYLRLGDVAKMTLSPSGLALAGPVTISNVTGSTQCLHVNSSGVVSGSGSDCGTGAGGATTALDNLASVNINTSLLAQTGVDLGSTVKPFRNLNLVGSGTFGTNYWTFTGTPTGTRTITIPDRTATMATTTGSATSGNCAKFDASGNVVDNGSACGTSSGIAYQGTPTATALVTSYDTSHVQTPSATATMDASGNISTPGRISSGVGSGNAGADALAQGTLPTFGAGAGQIPTTGYVAWVGPLSGVTTSYGLQEPVAQPSNQVMVCPSPTSGLSQCTWAANGAPVAGTGIAVSGSTVSIDSAVTQTIGRGVAGQDRLVVPASASGTTYTGCPTTNTPAGNAVTAYTSGMILLFKPDVNGTGGATTINVCTLGAKGIKEADGSTNPTSSDIVSGQYYAIAYDGTNFRLPAAGSGTGTVTTSGSPSSGQMSVFSGATAITGATFHNVATPLQCNDVSGSGTVQSCSASPTTTLSVGDMILYKTTTTNTGDVTVAVGGGAALHVRKWQGSSVLASGDLQANVVNILIYDGTYLELQTIGNAPGGSGTVTTSGSPSAGNISKFSGSTVIAPATSADINAPQYVAGGGSANAQTASYTPANAALVDGLRLCWKPTASNSTTTPTFAPDSLTAHTIVKAGGALAASDIITTAIACAIYDSTGTQWELQNPQTTSAGSSVTCVNNSTTSCTEDNFDSQSTGATNYSGTGRAGWVAEGFPSSLWQAGPVVIGHPGNIRGASTTTAATLSLGSGFDVSETFDDIWVFRETSDANNVLNTNVTIGVMSTAIDTPVSGFILQAVNTGTAANWFFKACASSTCGDSIDTGITASTSWLVVRMKRVDSTTVGVSINGGNLNCITTSGSAPGACTGTNTTSATHVPTLVSLFYSTRIVRTSGSATEFFDYDYARHLITGLSYTGIN